MRVLLPWRVTSKKSTWVPKSVTSKRRSSAGGSMVWRKSTRTVRPCCRRSIPVAVSERSTMICASPFLPRRKSTSWMLCASLVGLVSENCVVVAAAAVAPLPCSVTTTVLPSILVSYLTNLARLNTTRVRPPAWPNRIVRRSPWLTSWVLLPSPFAVFGKSSATRGGLFTVKDAGGFGKASLRPSLTVTVPACVETSIDCMTLPVPPFSVLVSWPCAAKPLSTSNRQIGMAAKLIKLTKRFIFAYSLFIARAIANCWCARSRSPTRNPG